MSSVLEVPYQIAMALSIAASATGADYDYLLMTAARESNFEARAAARTSSARGLFQFIEETWLMTLKEDGPSLGLGDIAAGIFKTSNGRYYVPEARERQRILDLRNDPRISALLAGAYTRRNAETLADGIGRKPTAGELYVAHFLGPHDAIRLVQMKSARPAQRADRAFPQAAKANPSIFYDEGRARSLAEVYHLLVHRYDGTGKPGARGGTGGAWRTIILNHLPASGTESTKPGNANRYVRRLAVRAPTPPAPLRKPAEASPEGTSKVTSAAALVGRGTAHPATRPAGDTLGSLLRNGLGLASEASVTAVNLRAALN
ncbi:MAG: lytic transglycosylase domain-containing protein [Rhizobiales bacterium]|nr:lytic transglycosylase domain-containing protein [Hyphomicrobiales bacterium]